MKKLVFSLLGIFFIIGIFFLFKIVKFYQRIYTQSKTLTKTQEEKIKEQTVFNFLLMGYGGIRHEGSFLTDTMMVIHVNLKKKKVVMISLPRDLWVKIPTQSGDDYHAKINTLYQIGIYSKNYPDVPKEFSSLQGASDLVKRVVGNVTGLSIDNYIAIDFEGFKKGVDILGGVDVEVEKAFDDFQYPIAGEEKDLCGKQESELPELEKIATKSPELAFPCRYEHLHFDAGLTHMDGETALKYVRSRHSQQDGSDFGRARRQQRFLEAVKEKVLSLGIIPKIIPLLDEVEDHMKTDVTIDHMTKFATEAQNAQEYTVTQLVLSEDTYLTDTWSKDGQYILIPTEGVDRWEGLKSEIKKVIGGATQKITPTVSLKLKEESR